VHKILMGTLVLSGALSGLIIGVSSTASAAPASPLLAHEASVQTAQVQPVYYYYNRHRYNHRSWEKKRRRWRYY
jgi:hypothetical protein